MPKIQQSSVDRLPKHIRIQLQRMIDDPSLTQKEALEQINSILETEGYVQRMSYSSLNRYAVKTRNVGIRIRQSREVATAMIGKLGAEPQGEVGKLLNEIVRNLVFNTALDMADGEKTVDPKMLKDLAIAIHRLERAASENTKREEEIRKNEREQMKEEALEAMSNAEVSNEDDRKRLVKMVDEVLGVR